MVAANWPFRSILKGPLRPPGPLAVRIITDSQSIMLVMTAVRRASTQKLGCQLPGVPLRVRDSMQMEPCRG